MDTITHIALGACIGQVVGGRRIGKHALVAGAVAQNIPDIDVITALWMDPSSSVLAHRGITHSFLFAIVFSLLLSWMISRGRHKSLPFAFCLQFLVIQLFTHIGIDAFNAYGTGLFEPFSHRRISFHGLYVMDPFFLLPVAIAGIILTVSKTTYLARTNLAMLAIAASSLYIGYALFNKSIVDRHVADAFRDQDIDGKKYFVTPTPFNVWLWFVAGSNDNGSFVGYRSVFDDDNTLIEFHFFPRNDTLLARADHQEEVNRLIRFSQGFYAVESKSDTIAFNDLRFGQVGGWQDPFADFTFHYYLHPAIDNKLVMQRGRVTGWKEGTFSALVRRIRSR